MKAPLRVVLVYLNAELASSRIRILQMAPWLERLGIETTALPYPKSGRAWRDLRRQAATADVVVIQKKLPGLLEGMRWRGLRTPVVFDFDDALPFRQRPKRGAWTSTFWSRIGSSSMRAFRQRYFTGA